MADQITNTEVQELLSQPVLARFATANILTHQPHVVTVWFYWDGEFVWISSFSDTRKMKDLELNLRVAVLIEPPMGTPGIQGVLMEGRAEVISSPAELVEKMSNIIYARYLGDEGAQAEEPQSWIKDERNRIIRIKPEKTMTWVY